MSVSVCADLNAVSVLHGSARFQSKVPSWIELG